MNESIFELIQNLIQDDDTRRIQFHQFSERPYNDNFRTIIVNIINNKNNWIFDYSDIPSDSIDNAYTIFYKGSPSDTGSPPRYIIGDICIKNTGKTNYLIKDSFNLALNDPYIQNNINDSDIIIKFFNTFKKEKIKIDEIINNHSSIEEDLFIHFNFKSVCGYEHWYQIPGVLSKLDYIYSTHPNYKIFKKIEENEFILKKSFISSSCSGNLKNDIQFPYFSEKNQKNTICFAFNELSSIFYYEKMLSFNYFYIHKNYYISIILKENNKTAFLDTYFRFKNELKTKNNKTDQLQREQKAEDNFKESLNEINIENLFSFSKITEKISSIASFDILFFDKSGRTNLCFLSLSNLHKSHLNHIYDTFKKAKQTIFNDLKWFPSHFTKSMQNIVGDAHYKLMIKNVLPEIYISGTFSIDFLSYYISAISKLVRHKYKDKEIRQLRSDYYYLTYVQNGGREIMTERQNSKSYRLGKEVGFLSFLISRIIGDFEKSYIGLIKIRCPELSNVEELITFCYEKAILHQDDKNFSKENLNNVSFLNKKINDILNEFPKEEYNVNVFAQGLFDGYFLARYLNTKKENSDDS